MNKGDLISAVAEATGISKAQAGTAVDTVFGSIEGALKKGDKAALSLIILLRKIQANNDT